MDNLTPYEGTNWYDLDACTPILFNDYCGVHTNSGVLNFWFYLLSDGGTGTNDNSHAFDVTGIGIEIASKIAYQAERYYLAPSSDFFDARDATISAAIDLFGNNNCEEIAVTDAWHAVGVGSAFSDNLNLQVSGDVLVCTSETFTLTNAPSLNGQYSHIGWSVSPSYLVTTASGTGNSPSITKAGVGDAIITFDAGCTDAQKGKGFHLGPYGSSDYEINGPSTANCGNNVYYSIPTLPGATDIDWTWPTGWTYVSGQGTVNLALVAGSSSGAVAVGVDNTCGPSGSYDYQYTQIFGFCFGLFAVYPNPAGDELKISFTPANGKPNTNGNVNDSYSVELYDNSQHLVYRTTSDQEILTISTSGLANGDYILHLLYAGDVIRRHVLFSN